MCPAPRTASSPIETVAETLENYAQRGVFRGFSRGPARAGRATFKMLWHRDLVFELILDLNRKTMRFPLVLPNVPAGSAMHKAFKEFVRSRQSDDLPEHRRIDKRKARVKTYIRGGDLSLTLKIEDEDYDYCARKFLQLVHEIYLVFLNDGAYYEYMVETFDLDPDSF